MTHRFVITLAASLAVVAAVPSGAVAAENAIVFVFPNRAGVPIIINHYDVRWAVVEGERGLDRPGYTEPSIIGGRYVGPPRQVIRSYYPTSDRKPQLGRHEVEPPANQSPPTAENFSRNWSTTSSQPVPPADLPNTNPPMTGEGYPMYSYPPVVVTPQVGPRPPGPRPRPRGGQR